MKVLLILGTALLLLTSSDALAQSNRQGVIVGVGTGSCGNYLLLRNAKSQHFDDSLEGWIVGFVSGMNHARFGLSKSIKILPDGPSMLAYVDKFCRDNPLKTVFNGADALFGEIPDLAAPITR
jgi:hypothetical protein